MSPDTLARPAALTVRPLVTSEEGAWEDFVRHAAAATFFHRVGWRRIIESTLGYRTHYRGAWRGGDLAGILPLVEVKSRRFGHALLSTGFTVGGGIAALDGETAQRLADEAARLGRALGVDFIELRQETLPVGCALPGWRAKDGLYCGFARALAPTAEANLKAIPRKKRADLRKAIDNPALRVETAAGIDTFFRLYGESLRNLGTPILPKRFYAAVAREFGDDVEISAIVGPRGPVAALMTFFFKGRAMPYYGGAGAAARPLHAYDLLYWRLMERAVARGATLFDFGRSKRGTGAFDYKTYWGFSPLPLAYRYDLPGGGELPEINPLNPKYRAMIAMWRVLPLPVANALGPLVARQIG